MYVEPHTFTEMMYYGACRLSRVHSKLGRGLDTGKTYMMIVFVVEHVMSFSTLSSRDMVNVSYLIPNPALSPTINRGSPEESKNHVQVSYQQK